MWYGIIGCCCTVHSLKIMQRMVHLLNTPCIALDVHKEFLVCDCDCAPLHALCNFDSAILNVISLSDVSLAAESTDTNNWNVLPFGMSRTASMYYWMQCRRKLCKLVFGANHIVLWYIYSRRRCGALYSRERKFVKDNHDHESDSMSTNVRTTVDITFHSCQSESECRMPSSLGVVQHRIFRMQDLRILWLFCQQKFENDLPVVEKIWFSRGPQV